MLNNLTYESICVFTKCLTVFTVSLLQSQINRMKQQCMFHHRVGALSWNRNRHLNTTLRFLVVSYVFPSGRNNLMC